MKHILLLLFLFGILFSSEAQKKKRYDENMMSQLFYTLLMRRTILAYALSGQWALENGKL